MGLISDITNGIKYVIAIKDKEETYLSDIVKYGFRGSIDYITTKNISEGRTYSPFNPVRFITIRNFRKVAPESNIYFKKVIPLKQHISSKFDAKGK